MKIMKEAKIFEKYHYYVQQTTQNIQKQQQNT